MDASAGSLVAMLSKVTVSNSASAATTPTNPKRIRSAGTTPEDAQQQQMQPHKMVKTESQPIPATVENVNASGNQSYSMIVRRTLNLKICIAQRPPAGRELQTIKQFLQDKIENALTDRAPFLPIFKDVCKIGKDGVYVFCSDSRCAEWITKIVKAGIPSIDSQLTVLPQDTPLKFRPELVMVRTYACFPTKQPKEKIMDTIAQMNKQLDTQNWHIKRIRSKGSSSMVYMRMDKRSFDNIQSQEGKINWILGPITIRLEEHRTKPKPEYTTSATNLEAATGNSLPVDSHLKPLYGRCGWHP